jgi:hypothetical protein
MDQLIQAKYTSFAADDVDYPNVSSITKKGTAPKPKSTIAADSISLAREKKIEKVSRLTTTLMRIICLLVVFSSNWTWTQFYLYLLSV